MPPSTPCLADPPRSAEQAVDTLYQPQHELGDIPLTIDHLLGLNPTA